MTIEFNWYDDTQQILIVSLASDLTWEAAHQASQALLQLTLARSYPIALILSFPRDFQLPLSGIAENTKKIFRDHQKTPIVEMAIVTANPELWRTFVQMYSSGNTRYHYVSCLADALDAIQANILDTDSSS